MYFLYIHLFLKCSPNLVANCILYLFQLPVLLLARDTPCLQPYPSEARLDLAFSKLHHLAQDCDPVSSPVPRSGEPIMPLPQEPARLGYGRTGNRTLVLGVQL